jgi:hypothetical protein
VSPAVVLGCLARMIGIVAIFSILGPLAFSALTLLIVAVFGAPLVELMLAFVNLEALRSIISLAMWLVAVASALAAFPPSALTGLIFALAAVGAGINAFWTAWLAAAVAVAGIIVLGLYIVPQDASAVILPRSQTAGQALALFVTLTVLAIPPVTLCWWLAKPLSRATIAA